MNGWYAFLNEDNTAQALCHKFDATDVNNVRLVITGVTIKNLVTSAAFSYDNTTAYEPQWSWASDGSNIQDYTIPPTLLNTTFYKSADDLSALSTTIDAAWWSDMPFLGTNIEVLISTGDAGKEHYMLMIPRKYVEDASDNLEIEIKYKVIPKYKLTGDYAWSNEDVQAGLPPTKNETTTFELEGISGTKSEPTSISAPIAIDLEANRSYHVAIRLGEMMKLIFEVTDRDMIVDKQSIDVEIPSFE